MSEDKISLEQFGFKGKFLNIEKYECKEDETYYDKKTLEVTYYKDDELSIAIHSQRFPHQDIEIILNKNEVKAILEYINAGIEAV